MESRSVEQIIVNKDAAKAAVQQAYIKARQEVQDGALKGQEYIIVQFSLPNYGDGGKVLDMLEKHGVVCCARGFCSEQKHDGSYWFSIQLRVKES